MKAPSQNGGGRLVALREGEPERGGMRPQRVVRHDRLRDQIGPLRLHPLVDMVAEVAVGPAVEAAVRTAVM